MLPAPAVAVPSAVVPGGPARPGRHRRGRSTLPLLLPESEPLGGHQAGGPLVSLTEAVWVWPEVFVHCSWTVSPGCSGSSRLLRSVAEVTVFPLSSVITSPCTSPAWAEGEPASVPSTTAPVAVLPLPLPLPLPKPPNPPPKPPLLPLPLPLESDEDSTLTPRKPVAPMWMVEDWSPASISLAIESAVAIGMA